MNWTEILLKGNVPEPPGYQETCALIKAQPYVVPQREAKAKRKR